MGKKRTRSAKMSKGERCSVAANILKAIARDRDPITIAMNKLVAWKKGQNPWLVIQNPQSGTNRPSSRVKSNDVWGNPKRRPNPNPETQND
jgi:2'-5' RNA ligase